MAEPSGFVVYPTPFPHVSPSKPRFQANIAQASSWQDDFDTLWLAPAESSQEQLIKFTKLKLLNDRFCAASRELMRQIVSEMRLPVEQRTFKLQSAHPERFVEQGILVEFCSDDGIGIYGGDRGAHKAAKRKLVALQCICDQRLMDLCLPLTCVVSCNGFRAVCSAWIPEIGATTLQYGREGNKFVCRDQVLNGQIERICRAVRVGAHNFQASDSSSQTIYGPAELEGHIVEKKGEKRSYLTNFERLMPPHESPYVATRYCKAFVFEVEGDVTETNLSACQTTDWLTKQGMTGTGTATSNGILFSSGEAPNPRASAFVGREVLGKAVVLKDTGSIFFDLLRPEAMKLRTAPKELCYVSSDAFSGFGCCQHCIDGDKACTHGGLFHNGGVAQVTQCLSRSVTKLAEDLNFRKITVTTGDALVKEMHRRGLNLQYYVSRLRSDCDTDSHITQLLSTEYYARCIRRYFRNELKRAVRSEQVKPVAVNLLNLILGTGVDSDKFWNVELPKLIQHHSRHVEMFGRNTRFVHPNAERQSQMMAHLTLRTAKLCGIQLSAAAIKRICSEPLQDPPFVSEDVLGIEPQVKGISFDEHLEKLIKDVAELTRGEKTYRQRYHQLVLEVFGPKHELSIISFSMLSLELARRNMHDEAAKVGQLGLQHTLDAFGPFSHEEAVALTILGEIAQFRNPTNKEALTHYRAALRVAFSLFGTDHALVGKLCSRLGQLEIKLGDKKSGLQLLGRGYHIYKQIYGDLADYLMPNVIVGKSEMISAVLNQLLEASRAATLSENLVNVLDEQTVEIKQNAVVGLEPGHALTPAAIVERITKSIRDLESMEGVHEGYFENIQEKRPDGPDLIELTLHPITSEYIPSNWELDDEKIPGTLYAGDAQRLFVRSATPLVCTLVLVKPAPQLVDEPGKEPEEAPVLPQPFVSAVHGSNQLYCVTIELVLAGNYVLTIHRALIEDESKGGSKLPEGVAAKGVLTIPLSVLPSFPRPGRCILKQTQAPDESHELTCSLECRDAFNNFYDPSASHAASKALFSFATPRIQTTGSVAMMYNRSVIVEGAIKLTGKIYTLTIPLRLLEALDPTLQHGLVLEMNSDYRVGASNPVKGSPLPVVGFSRERKCRNMVHTGTQALALLCMSCNQKTKHQIKCANCGVQISAVAAKKPAQYCHGCSVVRGSKCFLCKIHITQSTACAYICLQCMNLPRCVATTKVAPPPPTSSS